MMCFISVQQCAYTCGLKDSNDAIKDGIEYSILQACPLCMHKWDGYICNGVSMPIQRLFGRDGCALVTLQHTAGRSATLQWPPSRIAVPIHDDNLTHYDYYNHYHFCYLLLRNRCHSSCPMIHLQADLLFESHAAPTVHHLVRGRLAQREAFAFLNSIGSPGDGRSTNPWEIGFQNTTRHAPRDSSYTLVGPNYYYYYGNNDDDWLVRFHIHLDTCPPLPPSRWMGGPR